jgi:acetaldehyde dehydrogenase (acetylating)
MKFALEKPACRILANTQAALGAVGYTNELLPSMTLGPGTFGKSIISENVSAKHLINIKRLAFETTPINPGETAEARREMSKEYAVGSRQYSVTGSQKSEEKPMAKKESWMEEIEERIRLKAGNQPVRPKPHDEEKTQKTEGKEGKYGSGMTIEEVERVMNQFKIQKSK